MKPLRDPFVRFLSEDCAPIEAQDRAAEIPNVQVDAPPLTASLERRLRGDSASRLLASIRGAR